ncbi:MAG: hypothetical protein KBG02_15430 [Haliscomenobacter sp.]|nr:hypothetical protein [Haliscomenobacter sp.]MBP9078259.1 hypothetical protein [Haliscomenobacter sp.]
MRALLFLFLAGIALAGSSCSYSESAFADQSSGQAGSITRFAVFKGYMYALNQNEVQTYRLKDDGDPDLIHRLPTDYGLETIFIYENTIFLGSRTAMYILDITNPAAPALLSKSDRQDSFFGGCDPVVVQGHYAFSTIKIIQNICGRASSQSALLVYDVADKTAPEQIGIYPLNLPNGLGIKDHYLLVCDEGSDRVEVFDIADPKALKPTLFSFSLEDPYDLIIRGETMIVSTKTRFQLYDVRDMAAIRPAGSIAK